MKILIVEDEEILRDVLEEKFKKEDFDTKVAIDGEAGLQAVEDFEPDLILLDLIMPKMDGFEVLEALKLNPKAKSIPVIVLSNLNQDEEIKKALALGAVDFLVKTQHPINEVVEKVRKYLLKGK